MWVPPIVVTAGLLLAACSTATSELPLPTDPIEEATQVSGIDPAPVKAYTEADRVIIERGDDRWDFLTGVNLGVTIPGHYPGELAIAAETYREWFPMMTGLGIHTVRVYTIQRPHFYEELRAYNLANPDEPLFLVHGVWIDEERLMSTQNLYDEQLVDDFRNEMASAVGAVAGTTTLPERPGRASGHFTADVTPWLVGWILGIEPDPSAIAATDEANRGRAPHDGDFFSATADASPTETWWAAQLDYLASELTSRGLSMPVSFINWPTTDPLSHPYEPLADEDRVAIDANHVRPEPAWDGGYFASYHAYPYYPDFQRFEPALLEYESQGRFDPYAGYLAMLREHHAGLPVVVAEYGVPGGMGQAHRGPLGRDQGAHAEQDQMILNAEMMEVIRTEELAGGLVFEWADEWFKPTWNTVDLERPADRRGLWSNAYNAESHYGLVAIEPGLGNHVVVDGLLGDWEAVDATTILTGDGAVRQVLGTHDAAYLYLGLRLASESIAEIAIGFDVLDGESGGLPDTDGLYPESDYAWVLGPGLQAQALVRASNDPFGVRYGLLAGYFPAESADFVDGSRAWNEIRLLTSNPLVVPVTGAEIPAESFGVGQLVHGSTDPNDAAFDSRATWYRTGDTVELRVPYASIGISDPSSLQALRVHSDGAVTFETFDSVGISVVAEGQEHRTAGYGWARWDRVDWRQRLKAGADLVGAAMSDTSAP